MASSFAGVGARAGARFKRAPFKREPEWRAKQRPVTWYLPEFVRLQASEQRAQKTRVQSTNLAGAAKSVILLRRTQFASCSNKLCCAQFVRD